MDIDEGKITETVIDCRKDHREVLGRVEQLERLFA